MKWNFRPKTTACSKKSKKRDKKRKAKDRKKSSIEEIKKWKANVDMSDEAEPAVAVEDNDNFTPEAASSVLESLPPQQSNDDKPSIGEVWVGRPQMVPQTETCK